MSARLKVLSYQQVVYIACEPPFGQIKSYTIMPNVCNSLKAKYGTLSKCYSQYFLLKPNACFTSTAYKARSPLSNNAHSFMIRLCLVQVLLHKLRITLAMGLSSCYLLAVFPQRFCSMVLPFIVVTLCAPKFRLIIHRFCLFLLSIDAIIPWFSVYCTTNCHLRRVGCASNSSYKCICPFPHSGHCVGSCPNISVNNVSLVACALVFS